MKVFLAGHEGSKGIVLASQFLAKKYLPAGFEPWYLNYGAAPDGFKGFWVPLDYEQKGGANAWASYLRKFLGSLKDEYIIFALDDYLLAGKFDNEAFRAIARRMAKDPAIVSGRLCQSQCFDPSQYDVDDDGVLTLKAITYTATTQYCVWRREFLIDLLAKVSNPWQFEMAGSAYLNEAGKKTIGTLKPAMIYNDNSALSSKWAGVDWAGVKPEDKAEIEEKGLFRG